MKSSSLRFRILCWLGIAGLVGVWYSLVRLLVLIQASNYHRTCLSPYGSSWQQDYCSVPYVSAPSYLTLTYDRLDSWLYGAYAATILLGGVLVVGGLVLAMTLNGRFGRPFYSFVHVRTHTNELTRRGKLKRRHSLIIIRN